MNKKISIILAEDQEIFRTVLASYLNAQFEFEVMAQVSNGKDLMNELKKQTPDIVLMDAKMPVMDGYEVLSMIRNRFADLKVVIFSLLDSPEAMNELHDKGANGFVSKNDPVEVLSGALKEVFYKGVFNHKRLLEAKRNGSLNEKKDLLSEKELSVVKEVCNGLSNNQISQRLFISPSTVDFHKQNIYRKTGSKNVADVIRYAVRNKIISID